MTGVVVFSRIGAVGTGAEALRPQQEAAFRTGQAVRGGVRACGTPVVAV